jgi:hypothetical protein
MKHKRLSKADLDRLWGEDTPYSQVNLKEQSRILGDGISRIFLVVEGEINPFTFEYILAHRQAFGTDLAIQQLLDHAEYLGPQGGYLVCVGEEELIDKRSFDVAFSYREMALKNILKMHDFVIRDFGLKRSKHQGINISDLTQSDAGNKKYIWNEVSGQVIPVEGESLWDSESMVSSPAGEKNGKVRYFIVLALAKGIALKRHEVKESAMYIKSAANKFRVDIEKAEAGRGYMMLTVLIDTKTAPLDFIDSCISGSNKREQLFKEDHFITNISRPTGNEIMRFVKSIK